MKTTLTILLVAVRALIFAQTITLTQSFNEPTAGDVDHVFKLDTSAYAQGLPLQTGSEVVWNFSKLKAGSAASNQYLSAAGGSVSFNYTPGTIMQINASGLYDIYLKSTQGPSPQTEVVGLSTSSLSLTFTNSAVIAKYPMGYNTTFTDQIAGTVSGMISGTLKGYMFTCVDGYGTIQLPDGSELNNVLRVKSIQTITLSSGFFPLGNTRQTLYSYYHASSKFPVLSINYQKVSLTANTPSVHISITGQAKYFGIVGINDAPNATLIDGLYPNPANDHIYIDCKNSQELAVTVYNSAGQTVLQSTTNREIAVSTLEPGLYLLEAREGTRICRKKFIKS